MGYCARALRVKVRDAGVMMHNAAGRALNMREIRKQILVGIAALLAASCCFAQRIDPGIGRQIAAIQAIDNHAHPVLAPPPSAMR